MDRPAPRHSGATSRPRLARRLAPALLAVPMVLWLFPGLYARTTPRLGAFPFFLWYQFAASVVTGLLIAVVYLTREKERDE